MTSWYGLKQERWFEFSASVFCVAMCLIRESLDAVWDAAMAHFSLYVVTREGSCKPSILFGKYSQLVFALLANASGSLLLVTQVPYAAR